MLYIEMIMCVIRSKCVCTLSSCFCCIKHWLEIVGRSNQRNKSTMLAADGISLLHRDHHDHDGDEGKLRRKNVIFKFVKIVL